MKSYKTDFQKQQSFLRKRQRRYDRIRKKTRVEHLEDVFAYTPQVSKALRPWFLTIETTNDCEGYSTKATLSWFGNQIRIELRKILREYHKFERGEISDTCNNEYITVYFDDDNFVNNLKCKVPTELVIEVVRFLRQMNRFGETIVAEHFRYYTRQEKKRFADYEWRKRKYYHKKRGDHRRWMRLGRLSVMQSNLETETIPTVNFLTKDYPLTVLPEN